jgi:hypothetical protein
MSPLGTTITILTIVSLLHPLILYIYICIHIHRVSITGITIHGVSLDIYTYRVDDSK